MVLARHLHHRAFTDLVVRRLDPVDKTRSIEEHLGIGQALNLSDSSAMSSDTFAASRTTTRAMNTSGWYEDPFRGHEARWMSEGKPTFLVRMVPSSPTMSLQKPNSSYHWFR